MFNLFKKPVFNQSGIYISDPVHYSSGNQITVLIFLPKQQVYMFIALEKELQEKGKTFLLDIFKSVTASPSIFNSLITQCVFVGSTTIIDFNYGIKSTTIKGKLNGDFFETTLTHTLNRYSSSQNLLFKFVKM